MYSPDFILQNVIKKEGLSLCSEVLPLAEEHRSTDFTAKDVSLGSTSV